MRGRQTCSADAFRGRGVAVQCCKFVKFYSSLWGGKENGILSGEPLVEGIRNVRHFVVRIVRAVVDTSTFGIRINFSGPTVIQNVHPRRQFFIGILRVLDQSKTELL